MLMTTEIVRDVLANEVICLMREPMSDEAKQHVINMRDILISDDFQQVTSPDDVWLMELKAFCKMKRGEADATANADGQTL